MKRYFITSKKDIKLKNLITKNLKHVDADMLIEQGACWLDQKRLTDKNEIISAKQTIKVFINKTPASKYTLESDNIIFEDHNVLVVFKPDKLNVQSDFASTNNNLTFSIKEYLLKENIKYDPTPINRLDLNVSGLVLFAKNKDTEKKLFALSRERKIYKQYVAFLGINNHPQNRITITNKLGFKKNKACKLDTGKKSKSLFIKDKTFETFTRYNVFLYTGRRHQIRIHAADYIAPIDGDRKYGSKSKNKKIALTSYGLNFKLNNKKYRIRLTDKLLAVPK